MVLDGMIGMTSLQNGPPRSIVNGSVTLRRSTHRITY
jgi:hypothetical protein